MDEDSNVIELARAVDRRRDVVFRWPSHEVPVGRHRRGRRRRRRRRSDPPSMTARRVAECRWGMRREASSRPRPDPRPDPTPDLTPDPTPDPTLDGPGPGAA